MLLDKRNVSEYLRGLVFCSGQNMRSANYLLMGPNELFKGEFVFQEGKWTEFNKRMLLQKDPNLTEKTYIVPFHPIDFHCHGIDRYDFTEIKDLDLDDIERKLRERNINCVITLFLFQAYFDEFLILMETFSNGRRKGQYPHILGIALEGPLLSSAGGTPSKTSWYPTRQQWEALAECGEKGLIYIVLSPDIHLKGQIKHEEVLWIAETLIDGNVIPALGHFLRIDPDESGRAVTKLLECVAKKGKGPIISDHLYNDMPKNFTHAWRSPAARVHRQRELVQMDLPRLE